jgi:hypothetical protein
MALVLTLAPGQGFYVGKHHVRLSSIGDKGTCIVSSGGKEFSIDSASWVSLYPGVSLVASYTQRGLPKEIRIAIDAPELIVIRGNLE